ncbi:monocarboxylate transporter 9-like isoform X1 [Diorhabda sublineata]|uniref:monocarboxylate transporter 9-like isoform X1 n=1 Tax=Diorhabda sublineata TaxID=1163346 RepID=UPI0024E06648|nr:monocarboxylate transporter 9-like isoform X1 [Diorhabda sublineata]
MHKERKLAPPDGGWGWIVVIGVSIVNLCTRSIEQSFGLLFGDLLGELEIETTGAAVIVSALDALVNFSGLLVGPLIRAFSYRKISLFGTILCSLGLILTFPAKNMTHVLCTYSIINGLGVGLAASSTFVALSNYFVKRRGQAVGFSLAGTAVGMMLMPQAVQYLLERYSFRGAILILGAFAMNGIAGSAVLQPVKWHSISEVNDDEENAYRQKIVFYFASTEEMETIKETDDEDLDLQENQTFLSKNYSDVGIKQLGEISKQNGLTKKSTFPRNFSNTSFADTQKRRRISAQSLVSSYSRLDFTGSSIQLQYDSLEEFPQLRRNTTYPGIQLAASQKIRPFSPHIKQEEIKKTLWQKFVEFMDLDLLRCPIYLNLVLGLSLAFVAEQNFKTILPFFFQNLGYNKQDVATFLSFQAVTDILARLILPPICDQVKLSKKTFFMIGIFLLGISRSALAQQTEWYRIVIWLLISGFTRGATLINFTITIAEYTSKYSTLEKLPAAFGLHMVGKGLFIVILGPLLGYIRDVTESFPICIHSQTLLIMLCCLAWVIEYIAVWCRTRNKPSSVSNTTTTSVTSQHVLDSDDN